jgi:hypothetical protein
MNLFEQRLLLFAIQYKVSFIEDLWLLIEKLRYWPGKTPRGYTINSHSGRYVITQKTLL